MQRKTVRDRIVRALRSGPLYEGALALVVGGSDRTLYRSLDELRKEGVIERHPSNPTTWRLR